MTRKSDECRPDEILLHIPHSSKNIPAEYLPLFYLNEDELKRELLRMTDSYTDELFAVPEIPDENIIRFPLSRLVCDVERFRNDRDEIMAGKGMGVCYLSTSDLTGLKRVPDSHKREMLACYDRHHAGLTAAADRLLERYDRGLLIDCHSFSSEKLPYECENSKPRPDICIGQDAGMHTREWLKQYLIQSFADKGYSVDVDYPFSGTMVPLKHYHRDPRLMSAMIEINRGLYMDEVTGARKDSFDNVRTDIADIILGITWQP